MRSSCLCPAVLVLASIGCLLTPHAAAAQEASSSIEWKPGWREVGPVNYALATGLIAGLYGMETLVETPPRRLHGEFPGDGVVRSVVVADSTEGRDTAVELSDVGLYSSLLYPILDAMVVGGFVHGDANTTWQLLVINAQALGTAGLFGRLGQKLVGRERPYVQECEPTDDRYHGFCPPGRPNESFISGHTAVSTAAAALACVHHLHVPLYGGGLPDQLACAGAASVALATSTLRLVGDMHYISDVVMGLGVGAASGFLLPYMLHYQLDGDGEAGGAWVPVADRDRMGVQYIRQF